MGTMSEAGNSVTERGPHGSERINLNTLTDSYRIVGKDLKAKVWEADDGDRLLFFRVRDSDDGRKFNEFAVEIPGNENTDSDTP